MKLVVPLSYFSGQPRSELWQLDPGTGECRLWRTLPASPYSVRGKGVTGIARLPEGGFALCDFNRVLLLDDEGNVCASRSRRDMNDLHSVTLTSEGLLVTNTGRDTVDCLNAGLTLRRRWDALSREDWRRRWAGTDTPEEAYYDAPGATIPFRRRRLKDRFHFNHALALPDDRIVASSLTEGCFIDMDRFRTVSQPLAATSHDGVIWENALWITTVSGTVYQAPLARELVFQPVVDLFRLVPHHGWCRGLCLAGGRLFVGITVVQQPSYRTAWLRQPVADTRTGVYQLDLNHMTVERFFDLSHPDGARIFNLVEAQAC